MFLTAGLGSDFIELIAAAAAAVSKEPSRQCRDTGDVSSNPGSGRFPGNPFQDSCLGIPRTEEPPKGHKESDMTEQLSMHTYPRKVILIILFVL